MNFSLYIHIPFCVSKCIYCDFYSVPKNTILDSYVDSVINELSFRLTEYKIDGIKNKLQSVYIGGGTPSLLSNNQINKLNNFFLLNNVLTDDFEFTIEVNPDDVSENFIELLNETIINRISCGLQSMNDEVLQFVKRRGSASDNIHALELFNSKWKKNFSVDLICGLPGESEKSFFSGLSTILKYNPNHISMYSLTIEDSTPLGKMFNSGKIEYDFDFADNLWLKAKGFLEKNGYDQYEVSNFSKKGFESKHNLVYWNHQSYLGCGSGATGTVYNDDGTGTRWTNTQNIEGYINFWQEKSNCVNVEKNDDIQELEQIDVETSKIEFFLMGLRKLSGITTKEYENIFHQPIDDKIIKVFEKWEQKKLCKIKKEFSDSIRYSLGKNGILFLNAFLEEII